MASLLSRFDRASGKRARAVAADVHAPLRRAVADGRVVTSLPADAPVDLADAVMHRLEQSGMVREMFEMAAACGGEPEAPPPATTDAPARAPEGTTLAVPEDVTRAALASHPLVRALGVPTSALHSALLHVHARSRAAPAPAPTPAAAAAARKRPYDCPHCRAGYEVLDAREGHRLCDNCGVVLTKGALNLLPDPVHHDELQPARPRGWRVKHIRGVPDWMARKCAARDEQPRSGLWAELDNLNQFTNWPHDELERMERLLISWSAGGPTDARLAAVLLHPLLRDGIEAHLRSDATRKRLGHNFWATEDAVASSAAVCVEVAADEAARARLAQRARSALREPREAPKHAAVDFAHDTPAFPCDRCDRRFASRKEARYHCRLY